MPEKFGFTNPESNRQYSSENPIIEQVRENTLFSEKLGNLKQFDLPDIIFSKLVDGGPEALTDLENALRQNKKDLFDLIKFKSGHITNQYSAANYIREFLEISNDKSKNNSDRKNARKKELIGFLCELINEASAV